MISLKNAISTGIKQTSIISGLGLFLLFFTTSAMFVLGGLNNDIQFLMSQMGSQLETYASDPNLLRVRQSLSQIIAEFEGFQVASLSYEVKINLEDLISSGDVQNRLGLTWNKEISLPNGMNATMIVAADYDVFFRPFLFALPITLVLTVAGTLLLTKASSRLLSKLNSDLGNLQNKINSFEFEEFELFRKALDEHDRMKAFEGIARATQALAHDVRRPFKMLEMAIDTLSSLSTTQDIAEYTTLALPEVRQAIEKVDGLVKDIMYIESNTKPLSEEVSLILLVKKTLTGLSKVKNTSQISVEYDFSHSKCVFIDAPRIERVFDNIFINALQAMDHSGRLIIKTRETANEVEITVANTGSFIQAEFLPRLFESFFTSGKKDGTGLGLAIVKKLVEIHGGKISCHSERNKFYPTGIVQFVFTLPIASKNETVSIELPSFLNEFNFRNT